MISKFWTWLNRPDYRERHPDGRLVIRGPWAAVAVERFFDLFPLWFQRVGLLFLQLAFVAFLVAVAFRLLGVGG